MIFARPNVLSRYRRQSGFILIVALIFMIVLTVLGLAASGTTSIEALMARNFRDQDVAFSAAEAALRDAELRINGYYSNPASPVSEYAFNAACTNGLCDTSAPQPVHGYDFFSASAPGSNSTPLGTTTGSPTVTGVVGQPRYMIEKYCRQVAGESLDMPTSCQSIYRITAQSVGRLSTTRVTLQETYIP